MAIPTRLIKRRIKSIRSTGKIMKAMELVAASKMRKATQLALGTRPYARLIQEMVHELRRQLDPSAFALLGGQAKPERGMAGVTLLVILSSDRGLCGGFNNQLLKVAFAFAQASSVGKTLKVVTVGRRAEQAVRRSGWELVASFEAISNAPSFVRAKPVLDYLVNAYLQGEAERVYMAFTDFKSALTQQPTVVQLLPIVPQEELTSRGEMDEPALLFEPTPSEVMQQLLPKMVEMESYQAFLESAASEHAARMMAMKSAGDAAGEMLEGLTFTLNQARQAAITREISEISAGKAAIE